MTASRWARQTRAKLVSCSALVVIVLAWVFPRPASAQAGPSFESIEIALWPEFDRQSMLVIYRANLPASTVLPANVSLPIPAGVEPNAVAQGEADGRLVDVPFTVNQGSDSATANLQVSSRLVWLEFYQDLSFSGSNRSFDFKWPGGISAGSFTIEVQTPPGVSDLALSPTSTDEIVGEYGLTYKRANMGPVGVSDQPSLHVSYSKTSDGLTIDSINQAAPTVPSEPPVGSVPEPSRVILWAAIGLVVIVLAVVAVMYFRVWRQPPKEPSPRKRHRPRSSAGEPPAEKARDPSPSGRVYCHSCGELAGPGDRFCRSCGTRLRL